MDIDDLDIYDDLDTFQQVEEKKSAELLSLESKYNDSLKTNEELQKENADLKKQLKRLNTNFQNLLNTAKAEINRKDKQIERLHKEKDDICFRRNQRWMESVDVASTNINHRNKNVDARILTQNSKTQFNHNIENDTNQVPCIAERKVSDVGTKTSLDAYARMREESLKSARRDKISERRNESRSNHEEDTGRRHMQREEHKLMRYKEHSRERVESGHYTTRDNSHSYKSRSREHVRAEKRDNSSNRSYSDSKERNAYSNKSEYSGSRQHSYDTKGNKERHGSGDRSRFAYTETSRERHSGSKRTCEDSKKPTTYDDNKAHKKRDNSDKNKVKASFDIDHQQNYLVKLTKNVESTCENTKLASIKKVDENGSDPQELNKTRTQNKILCEELGANQNSYNIEEKPVAENSLTKENLLALGTETCEKSSCRMTTDGKISPQMTVLFENLFGSSPSRKQSMNYSLLSSAKLENSSSSTTTSPSKYTDSSEQIAPTSKNSLPKSEFDECFVPIKGSEPEKSSLSDRNREIQISEENSDDTTTMSSNSANDIAETVKPIEVSSLIALSDDEIQTEFANDGERNDTTDVKSRDESTFEGPTNVLLAGSGGRIETLQDTRLPNIYEIRALQRRLKAEAAKLVKNSELFGKTSKLSVKTSKPSLNTTKLALKTSEISIKKTEMTSNTIATSFINPEENCKDAESQKQGVKSDSLLDKTKNSLSNPLEESVVTDAVVIASDQKKEIGITNSYVTEEESGDFAKKKQHTNSESENIVENPAIAKSATTDSIKLEQEISVCKSTAEKLAITNKKETNVVEVQSRCQTPANKSVVSNKTEAEANDSYKVKSNRQSKSEIRIIKAKETILEGYDVGEFHMQSSSKGKNSLLPSNNEKSRIQANAPTKSCVVEEKMSGKCPAVLSTNPTECHKPMEKVKDIASATEISDQSKNNEIFQSNMSCENDSFSREDPAKITRSTGLEVNHGMEGNVLAPCEDAVKMKGDTASPVGKKERSNKQEISDEQDVAQVQKIVDELEILNEQKVADKQTIADGQENVNKQKIADEQEFVERQKITDRQEIAHEQKIGDEQKVVKTNEKIGIEVQKSADGEAEIAKHKPSESPNECHIAIENENTNAKSSETKVAESSKLNKNNRVESNESITQRASKDDNSKAVNAENSAINVNVNSKSISAIAKSDSDVQADSKQKRVDEKRAVLNGGNSQTDNNRTKSSDIRDESEPKKLQDELSYLFSSKEVRYLDEIQAKSTKASAPKAGEEHLKKNKGSAADDIDDKNSEKQTRELVKSRELSLERNALLYNMKRAEIMSKFKIPKISGKRKRENNDEANKAPLENGVASEDGVTRNPKTNDGVEERMDRNKKKPKKEYNSITQKMLLKKDETKVVEINANAERELIDKRLPNGRTPEEEQALSAKQIQSERIIKEIDNWARRTVGAASEIIENTINESGKPHDSGAELLTTKDKNKVVTASVTQEGQQKTEINSTFPVVQKSSKMGIEKSLTPAILPPQLCEHRERGEKEQLANIAAVNGGDLENVPSHLPNKRCKHNSSADMKASNTFNNQKTDKHKPPKDSKSHQTPTNKSEVNCKERTKHVAGAQQQRTGQANELSICSEEGSAKYGKTHDGVDQNAVTDGEAIAPRVGVQDLSKMVESSERARKEMTNESQTLKIKKTESENKTGNGTIQASEQLECKSKIQHSTEKVSSTSQADSKQVATDIPNNNSKCSFAEKPTENHNSHKEKVKNTALEKKRDTDKQLSYAAEEPMAADSHEKCTKTIETMKTIENVQKLSNKEISATREATESLPNRSMNVVPSFSNTIIDRPKAVETGVHPGSEYKHSKPSKRHSSDVRTNDECEVISKPHKRKRCQLRIEDSEEEDACNTECATTMLPTPEPQEVSASDSQDIDILDILQNDRINESNATLPAPETPSALPANISQDEQYKEIDSRLEQMFASPKVTDKTASAPQVRTLPQPNADIRKLKGFQPVQPHSDEKSALETSAIMPGALEPEKSASASATRSLDFNVSDSLLSDISCTALQVSDPNITIDETNHSAMSMNSTLSDGNLSTKRISLGSSDYRFEKISDNVVNLFITRKRRGKRKEMIDAVTTTTIPTNTVSKT